MYAVSTNFKTAIKQQSPNVSCKCDIGHIDDYTNGTQVKLLNASIIDFNIESQLSTGNMPSIGGAISSKLTIKLLVDGLTPTSFTYKRVVKPYVGVEVTTGVWEWVPMGVFYIDLNNIKKTDQTVELDCYDRFEELSNTIFNSGAMNYPSTISEVLWSAIALDYSSSIIVNVKPIGSVRQVLSDMAELMTSNAIVDRTGTIGFKFLTDTTFTIGATNYMDFKLLSDNAVTITQLVVEKEDVNGASMDLFAGYIGCSLTMSNDQIDTTPKLQAIYNAKFPYTYIPYECTMQGMPQLDIGDNITLTDIKGVVRKLCVVSHKFIYSGGLISEIKAEAPSSDNSTSGSTGSNSISYSIGQATTRIGNIENTLNKKLTAEANFVPGNLVLGTNVGLGTGTIPWGTISGVPNYALNSQLSSYMVSSNFTYLTSTKITGATLELSKFTPKETWTGTIGIDEVLADRHFFTNVSGYMPIVTWVSSASGYYNVSLCKSDATHFYLYNGGTSSWTGTVYIY